MLVFKRILFVLSFIIKKIVENLIKSQFETLSLGYSNFMSILSDKDQVSV